MATSVLSINELISASKLGDVDYVRRVELADLQNWKSDDYGSSALIVAAAFSNTSSVCEEILKRCPSLLYKVNNNEVTALHAAAHKNNSEVVEFLLRASTVTSCDNSNKLLTTKSAGGRTALHTAVEGGNLEATKLIIEADPSKNVLKITDKNGDTAMHMTVKNNNLGIVKLLIAVVPGIEYTNNLNGQTPLFIAFQEALTSDGTRVEIRKLLIQKQPRQCEVPIGIGANNWTLLHHAACKGDLSTIKDIIQFCCPECLKIADIDKQNFLHIAVKYEKIDVVKYFSESMISIDKEILNGKDNRGNTPLHIAAFMQNATIAPFFLYNSKVSKEIRNMRGQRAIDVISFDYDKRKAEVNGLTNRTDEKEIKDQTEYDLLVCALIAAASFGAGITIPGGYISDGPNKGKAIFAGKFSFKVFVMSNIVALLFSIYGVFSHFCLKHLYRRTDIISQLKMARYCTFGAIFAWVVTAIATSYAILDGELCIIVSALCGCFISFVVCALWKIKMQDKPHLH